VDAQKAINYPRGLVRGVDFGRMEQLVAQPQIALPDVPGVGEILAEKYRVEGVLGVGGMGVVLGARHLQLGQVVAIKVLSVSIQHQQDAVERFLREGRAAAALNSDHVVRIYDVGQLPSGLPFMVMERLRGQDLSSQLTEGGPLSIADGVEYVAQATMAIVEAHEVGIVHRDLKPANLFLTRRSDGSACVKVLDFGISKQLTDLETQTLHANLTSTRQVMGSPAYMSPEQVRDAKTVDHRTDIWALGVTLYELLTQRAAFDADTLPAICAAIAADPPVPIRARRADVPHAVAAIIHRCLEKSPANRYPTARSLLTALREYQGKSTDGGVLSRGLDEAQSDVARLGANDLRSADGASPQTSASVECEQPARQNYSHSEVTESGPRDINSLAHDAVDGTLVSGRQPALGFGVNPGSAANAGAASKTKRPVAIAALIVLVLGGAASAFWVAHQSHEPHATAVAATNQPKPAETPKEGPAPAHYLPPSEQQPVVEKTHFALHINSEPSQALVLEAGNPLGVTPLSIEVDRTVVQRTARQFVVRKAGYIEVGLQQGDSLTDVQQNVTLPKLTPGPAEVQQAKSQPKPRPRSPSPTSNIAPSGPTPGIRVTR